MQIYHLKHDIKVLCVEARSFPGGIKDAFNKINRLPQMQLRHIFGISKPLNGMIRYRAAASANKVNEAGKSGYSSFTINAGNYVGEKLTNWQQNEMMIMSIFNRLVADKRIDGSAYCIEWYKSENELWCMVLMCEHETDSTIKELAI